METAKIAEPIWGDKLYQQRAREAFPILVRQSIAGQPIFYSDLADELQMPNPRNLNYVLGSIGQTLQNLSLEWQEKIPPINCIVINKSTGLPGEGVGWFIDDKNKFETLPRKNQRAIVDVELQNIYAYRRWLEILHLLGLEYQQTTDYSVFANQARRRLGQGESEYHRKFKEFINQNPQILGLPKSTQPGHLEFGLPSGDTLDVLFIGKTDWVVAEAKSRISDTADIYRGIYQCVKYNAIVEAYQSEKGLSPSCRVILVLQNKFPKELIELKNLLGVEVIDNIFMEQENNSLLSND